MIAGGRERRASTGLNVEIERAYLVRGHDLLYGLYPLAEPIVLVDPALAHLHPACRQLELLGPPEDPKRPRHCTTRYHSSSVGMRAACLYESARPAVVVRDLRSTGA